MPEKVTTASIDAKTPTDRVQRKRGQRVEQIVRTAAALFGERGFDAVSLEDVAEQLDVTKGSLYYYFASKEELGTAAIETLGNDWVARLRDTASGDFESTTARLYAVVREHIAIAVTEYPAALALFLVPKSWPRDQAARIKDLRRRHNDVFAEILAAGREAGEFQLIDVNTTLQCMHAAMSQAPLWIGRLEGDARIAASDTLADTLMVLTRQPDSPR